MIGAGRGVSPPAVFLVRGRVRARHLVVATNAYTGDLDLPVPPVALPPVAPVLLPPVAPVPSPPTVSPPMAPTPLPAAPALVEPPVGEASTPVPPVPPFFDGFSGGSAPPSAHAAIIPAENKTAPSGRKYGSKRAITLYVIAESAPEPTETEQPFGVAETPTRVEARPSFC